MEFLSFSINVDYHKQFLKFLSFLQKHGLLYAIFGISFPSQKMWTIICIFWNFFPKTWTMISNLWNFIPFSINMDYHMKFLDYHKQFMEFLSLLQKHGLSYAISKISFPSKKTWIIICNFLNFFPFSKNVDYYMYFLEFLFKNVDYDN